MITLPPFLPETTASSAPPATGVAEFPGVAAPSLDFASLLEAVAALPGVVPPPGAGRPAGTGAAGSPPPPPAETAPTATLAGWPTGKALPDEGAFLPPALPPVQVPTTAIAVPIAGAPAGAPPRTAQQDKARFAALPAPQSVKEQAALPAPREIPPPAAPQIAGPALAAMQPETKVEIAVDPDPDAPEADAPAPSTDPGTLPPPPTPVLPSARPSAPTPVLIGALVPAAPPVSLVPALESARAPANRMLRAPAALAGRGEVSSSGLAPVSLPSAGQGGQPDSRAPRPAAVSEGATGGAFAALAASEASPPQGASPLQPASLTAPATPLPDRPVATPTATVANAPHIESAIAQVGDLREALRAARPAMTLNHAEFGSVSLRLEPAAPDQWRAVLASRDPGFVPAIHAALAERAVAATADASTSLAGQHGAPQNGTSDHRYGASPNGSQGSSQPYPGQSGNRDGEAAPDHRRPSTAAALAARGEEGAEEPGGRVTGAGGLFA